MFRHCELTVIKGGGISQVSSDPSSATFSPEFVDTIELGLKSQFWDTLQLNVALHSSEYTDLQTNAFGANGPQGGNAGEASISGIEVELKWLLSDVGSLDGSFAYTDATCDDLISADPLDHFRVAQAPL